MLWVGTIFFAAGNWVQQIALGWLVYDRTHDPFMVGIVNGARTVPFLLVGPIGGVFSDRMDRRKMLLAVQFFLAAFSFTFAILILTDTVKVWQMIGFSFFTGAGYALMNPLRQTITANTVPREDLPNAIALNSAAFNLNRVLGPAMGGVLIAVFGPGTNFLVQASCYVIVSFIAFPMRTDQSASKVKPKSSPLADLSEGVRYTVKDRTILAIIMLAILPSFFVMPFTLGLMPVFAKDVLHQEAGGLGFLLSMFGVGGLFGVVVLATSAGSGGKTQKGQMTAQVVWGVIGALAAAAVSQMNSVALAVPFLILEGWATLTFAAMNSTHLQSILPDKVRGRVMGLYMLNVGMAPLGALVGGILASHYGSDVAILCGGITAAVLFIVTGFVFRKVLWEERPMTIKESEN